jgi:hypothetical protein
MSETEPPTDEGTGAVRHAGKGGGEPGGTGGRDMDGNEATPPAPPELPLDDDGTNARNIGG